MTPATASANSKYSGIVVDAKTGKTLYSYKADTKRYPASLTKIMTLYMLFEEMEAGRMSLQTRLKVSKYAASRPPSKLGLKPGSTIRAKDAILALVTKSANDVAVVVAENISGSVSAFGRRMTQRARQIGMKSTTFRNPSGLPNGKQVTTARDMALLGRAVQERFPKYYKYFSTRLYKYKGRRYGNHNRLLGRVKGVDGIKTGYIRASGFNLVTSVKRSNRHIVAVVMGGRTGASRNAQMKKLIASYLPKASRGKRTAPMLVARGVSAIPRYAELRNIPVPDIKPLAVAEIPDAKPIIAATQLAHGDIVTGSIVPVPQKPGLKAALRRKSLAFASTSVPLPPAAAPRAPARSEPVIRAVRTQAIKVASAGSGGATLPRAPADASVTVAANNTADPEPGWQIQIAAAESEDGAIAMLKKAQGRTGPALRGYAPHTEPVDANGTTLYRARFVGFKTKTAAWDTCKTLKRNKFNCYAVYQ
ncbi:D-alanyl-D-alanine carboxypeptidase [Stappia sp. ES.058]|uniref:D-alanyl-D-alanine carboxypeptidase n=1 Tax=Stappia sp. ES.058 TaxID=1881061 RepID=UPI001FCD15C3|nr:D-alanyl-D-alanine carboxypeptidase [Stappia sp. ES.058]